MSASGDPHITSIWGCSFDADTTKEEAVLMKCGEDELKVHYNEHWKHHIFKVSTVIGGVHNEYDWRYLKHSQQKTICGNSVEFHRYYSGINVRVLSMRNYAIEGLFNDSSCLEE